MRDARRGRPSDDASRARWIASGRAAEAARHGSAFPLCAERPRSRANSGGRARRRPGAWARATYLGPRERACVSARPRVRLAARSAIDREPSRSRVRVVMARRGKSNPNSFCAGRAFSCKILFTSSALWDARFLAKSRAYEQLVSSVQNNAAPPGQAIADPARKDEREDFRPPFFCRPDGVRQERREPV